MTYTCRVCGSDFEAKKHGDSDPAVCPHPDCRKVDHARSSREAWRKKHPGKNPRGENPRTLELLARIAARVGGKLPDPPTPKPAPAPVERQGSRTAPTPRPVVRPGDAVPCKPRRTTLHEMDCIERFTDANALGHQRDACYRCPVGKKRREAFAGGVE